MRSTLLLLAVLAPINLQAQSSDVFSFWPRLGTVAGGTEVELTATAVDWRCCGTPQVLFDGVASPQVTMVSATLLRAVTPPHLEGVVDVEVRLGEKTYGNFFKFGYYRARDPLLIPVAIETAGGFGSRWTTDIWVYNDSDAPVNLQQEVCFFIGLVYPCGNPLIAPAHGSMRIPPRRFGADYPELYLFPPSDVREQLHFNIRVRNAANSADLGTEIPAVSSTGFRNTRLILTNVPIKSGFRSVLRVYDQQRIAGNSMSVRIYDETNGALLVRRDTGFRPAPTDNPLWFSIPFFDLLDDPALRGHDTVRVEIEEPNAMLWAMLTLTDNVTQRVTVLTSQ